MTPPSSLPAIVNYLFGHLDDQLAVTVLWGPPPGDDHPAEFIAVGLFDEQGNSSTSDREFKVIGGGQMEEKIQTGVMVDVLGDGGVDRRTPFERSFEIAAEVEAVIRADIELGGLIFNGALSHWRGGYFRKGEAAGHRLFLTLTGKARI